MPTRDTIDNRNEKLVDHINRIPASSEATRELWKAPLLGRVLLTIPKMITFRQICRALRQKRRECGGEIEALPQITASLCRP